jgi:hypothetical protein
MTEHRIEPELSRSAPRPVRRRVAMGWEDKFQRIFAIVMLAGLWGFAGAKGRDEFAHFIYNASTPGVIAEQVIPEGESAYVIYSYTLNGMERRGRQVILFEQRAKLQPGAVVTVRVLRLGPLQLFALSIPSPMGAMMLLVCAMFLVMTLVILGYQYYWPRCVKALFSRGAVAAGKITGTSTFTRRGTNYYINYEFTTAAGKFIMTRMLARKADYERAEAGVSATVLYSEAHPHHNILYGYSEYTCS